MNSKLLYQSLMLVLAGVVLGARPATAQVNIQCPCDRNADGDCEDILNTGPPSGRYNEPELASNLSVQCMHLAAGDGFARMADGRPMFIFSFNDVTGTPADQVMTEGMLGANWPAPPIAVDEGKDFYLSLTNVGMVIRPDLFDPHTVHFHGFPQSSTVFDGLPESGIAINQGSTLTYYYHLVGPGTFMYHCHVEATEHMQMGMLGSLYVHAAQAGPLGSCFGGPCTQFVYNDGDGSTGYDKEYALQLGSFDPDFHDGSWNVQPLPFALMWDRYPMINGRGYPDTVNTGAMPQPLDPDDGMTDLNGPHDSQLVSSLIEAIAGEKVLLRLSNLNITTTHTLMSPSIPMRVVGIDAKELVAEDGTKIHYTTNSVTMGGGESRDVILDTTGVPAGTYYLYASNLQYLANNDEVADLGGMMTEIHIQ
jgi:FtsP/CotA-like multicopper oxidase with cupredoxin domain